VYIHRVLIIFNGGANAFFVEEKQKDVAFYPSYGSWHITWLGFASNMHDLNFKIVELTLCGEFGDPQLVLNQKDPHPIIKLEMMMLIIMGLLQICVMFPLIL
jgi:hypothetical protein